MKVKFTQLSQSHRPGVDHIPVLCTRCGDEYLSGEMIYGQRDGEAEWQFFCRNDTCYGRQNSGIYEKTLALPS